ncbi:hypothetical protein PENNAL_c0035G00189 [Penicillium nalgiovense]|uniref:Uncharacterized protein n=1 Tax=Penicillium nalgiovense TaxID=60175 RepID=A0A1V6Y5U1_PENNA|nr:hypothetical protein PENNAL_c0035G00189 [Penicillium nalgiovense]
MAPEQPPRKQLARIPTRQYSEGSPLICAWDDTKECLAHLNELSRHPSDMVLTLGDGHAILTPVHNLVGFHPAIGPSKSHIATRPNGANGISMKKWQNACLALASCDGPTSAYCGTIRSGDSRSVTDESDRKLSSVDDAASSVTSEAGGKRKSMAESAYMLKERYKTQTCPTTTSFI